MFAWYPPFFWEPTALTIDDKIPATNPGIKYAVKIPMESKTPFLFTFFIKNRWKMAVKKPVKLPMVNAKPGLKIKSEDELYAIPP